MSKLCQIAVATALASLATAGFAEGTMLDRNVNQQQRIEQGLQSGQLNTREAARLEREESRVDRMESRALRDGTVSAQEQTRINQAQDKVSRDIYREKHDVQTGNPNSASSQRLQADVQRNINQQQRIRDGVASGQVSNREAARLERGQARVNRREGMAGADGHVGGFEQHRIQHAENRQSRHIHHARHN